MHAISSRLRLILSTRAALVAGAVLAGLCQMSATAHGQALAKAIKPPDPPSQPAPNAPSIPAGTIITLNFVRSIAANRGAIPLVSVTADDKALIAVTPAPTAPAMQGDLADIALTSTFYGKHFTFTFRNIPADKNGVYTLNLKSIPDPASPTLQTQIAQFNELVKETILAKLPVNASPEKHIEWKDPVMVKLTPISSRPLSANPKPADVAAFKAAVANQKQAIAAVKSLATYSEAVDKAFIAAAIALTPAGAADPVKATAAAESFKDATELKNRIDATKPLMAKTSKEADDAVTRTLPASLSGAPQAYDPAPAPTDTRTLGQTLQVTTTLVFKLQE